MCGLESEMELRILMYIVWDVLGLKYGVKFWYFVIFIYENFGFEDL